MLSPWRIAGFPALEREATAIVADIDGSVRPDCCTAGAPADLGDVLDATVRRGSGKSAAGNLGHEHGTVSHSDRALRKLQTDSDNPHLSGRRANGVDSCHVMSPSVEGKEPWSPATGVFPSNRPLSHARYQHDEA